jgi:hypothetical protein
MVSGALNAAEDGRDMPTDESVKLVKKASWYVRLGTLEWSRYTYERPENDPLRLLGSVKRGLQMGALAINEQGQYVQVVGDFITPLNSSQISRALAKLKAPDHISAPRPVVQQAPAPVVTVKRRRIFVVTPSTPD